MAPFLCLMIGKAFRSFLTSNVLNIKIVDCQFDTTLYLQGSHDNVCRVQNAIYEFSYASRFVINWNKYVVVKKTVHKRNRRTKAWEPALHTHARQEEYKDEVGTCEDRSGWIRLVCS